MKRLKKLPTITALWFMRHTRKARTLIALASGNAIIRLQYNLIMFIKIDFVTWIQGFKCSCRHLIRPNEKVRSTNSIFSITNWPKEHCLVSFAIGKTRLCKKVRYWCYSFKDAWYLFFWCNSTSTLYKRRTITHSTVKGLQAESESTKERRPVFSTRMLCGG